MALKSNLPLRKPDPQAEMMSHHLLLQTIQTLTTLYEKADGPLRESTSQALSILIKPFLPQTNDFSHTSGE